MRQYVIETDDKTTLAVENVEGALKVRETQIPILNCYDCKHLTYEDGGHMEWYAYCKLRKQIIWTAQHWCSFGEVKENDESN